MNKPLQLVAMLVIVALVAAAACFLSARVFGPLGPQRGVSGHEWIHKQLDLTSDEQRVLEPIETRFVERRRILMGEIRTADNELAEAIKQDQADSPRISAAVERIHHAQGKLQEATLEHVFEMKRVLTPEQYQKLLNLTADELNQVNGGE
jgi:Spy/CpxP family protein refolding chaperone